ncbi:DMT family transporter [Acaryochloris sp. IP29b_bin.148]|uniref:DMT family transporter n=1 Tax=Acaryochloris sp. IP29b_bin.148 TaxID=2969218 RepID=UPI002623F068|nr:DMT family transporter [Acaryochloris sp. IP29b_bin.148]
MITKAPERPQQSLGQLQQPTVTPVDDTAVSPSAPVVPFVALIAAVGILSFSAIFTRLSEQELSASATIFNRFWIASLALGMWSGFHQFRQPSLEPTRPSPPLQGRDLLWFLCLGILIYGRAGSWAWSLTQTSVANSNLLHNMTPLFATLGGWLFLGHRFNRQFLMGMGLALTGVLAIGIGDFQVGTSSLVGDGAALLSAVFYAANFLVIERLRVKFSTSTIMLASCMVTGLLTLPIVLLGGNQLFPTSTTVWLAVIALGVISQGLGQGLLAYCLKQFTSGFVSVFMLLEPLITAILAWKIFSEQLNLLNWIAFFVVLMGLYLATISKGASKSSLAH